MQPTRWDAKGKFLGRRLQKREKLALLQRYETQMQEGRNREQILEEIADGIGVTSTRQVERILAQAKQYREETGRHKEELSTAALKLVEILDWYHRQHLFTIVPYISSDFPYTTHLPESPTLNERELSNLLAHLKDEVPELTPIAEYPEACKQWFALDDRKGEKETPTATITLDLILKLKLKANQGDFTGRCPDCPH